MFPIATRLWYRLTNHLPLLAVTSSTVFTLLTLRSCSGRTYSLREGPRVKALHISSNFPVHQSSSEQYGLRQVIHTPCCKTSAAEGVDIIFQTTVLSCSNKALSFLLFLMFERKRITHLLLKLLPSGTASIVLPLGHHPLLGISFHEGCCVSDRILRLKDSDRFLQCKHPLFEVFSFSRNYIAGSLHLGLQLAFAIVVGKVTVLPVSHSVPLTVIASTTSIRPTYARRRIVMLNPLLPM